MKNRQTLILVALALFVAESLRADCPFGLLSPAHYDANVRPGDIATADFNGDGYVDLAIVNRQSDKISILLGAAGGVFGAPTQITLQGETQYDIKAADFNNDGIPDLIVSIPNSPSVNPHLEILLGNGDGTFLPVPYTDQQLVYQNPRRIALGDFDHDGLIDAVVAKESAMFSSMTNIGGKMAQVAEYTKRESNGFPSGAASGIAAGDFDGDGNLDVAVSETVSKKVYLFYGVGDGTFSKSANTIDIPEGTNQPQDVQAGDFNGDGKDDLAIVMGNPDGGPDVPRLRIALSNGVARTFTAPIGYGNLNQSTKLVVRDIDGDGKLDVLVGEFSGVSIFRGNGNGTFGAQQTVGTWALGLAVDDFDRDGGLTSPARTSAPARPTFT